MASSNDPRIQLEKLAEKQVKSALHAKFLEDCLAEEIVPKGLEIKLKVSVGNDPEDIQLQASVDRLLEKTSLHVVNIIKEGHMRKMQNLGNAIEEVRGKLKKKMSNEQLFDMDSEVFKKTEEKKNVMTETHKKKLSYLKQRRAEKITVNENSGGEKEQKKSKETVSTENLSSDLPSGADKCTPPRNNQNLIDGNNKKTKTKTSLKTPRKSEGERTKPKQQTNSVW